MNTKLSIHWTKRVALLTTTGALALAPLLSVSPAQAQPRRSSPPIWNNTNRTLVGIVTRDLAGGSFELRAENGQTFRVRLSRIDEPRSLDRGDRVRVSGQFDNGVFVARNLDFIRDTGSGGNGNWNGNGNGGNWNNNGNWNNGGGNGNWNNQTWLTGTVVRDLQGDSFVMRSDTGRDYIVRIQRYDEPRSLGPGDRIRVSGSISNNVFLARNLEFLRDNGGNNGYLNELELVTGTVTRDLSGNTFELRADNGRIVRVSLSRGSEPRSLDRGDRVRLRGRLFNNVFQARDIEFLRDTRR
jgi:uncharacterized protein YdeI (BOF family)